jgi:hypothetical protein
MTNEEPLWYTHPVKRVLRPDFSTGRKTEIGLFPTRECHVNTGIRFLKKLTGGTTQGEGTKKTETRS